MVHTEAEKEYPLINRKSSTSDKAIIDHSVKFNAMNWDIMTKDKVVVRDGKKVERPSFHPYGLPMQKGDRVIKFRSRVDSAININIETWADVDGKTYMCWGDYWVKEKLSDAFMKLGANVNVAPQDADVTIYLWGSPFPQRKNFPYMYNPATHNIMWFYSHPEKMTESEILRYDTIFCLSENYIKVLNKRNWHPNVIRKPMWSCSDFVIPPKKLKDRIDIVFVGNSRGGLEYGRKAIHWLRPPSGAKVKIFGHKWYRQPQFDKWFSAMYWDFDRLNELYYTAKITLIDGHDEMNTLGFVQMKIFDVLCSGGFPLSHYNPGMKHIFGDLLPMYQTKNQMNALIGYYLDHSDERKQIIKKSRVIALKHTYLKRAQTFIDYIEEKKIV